MPQLKIKTITNREVLYAYEDTDTVKDLKQSIQNKTGTPIDEFKLIFSGQTLEDNKKLQEYKVEPNCIVRMHLAFIGGYDL